MSSFGIWGKSTPYKFAITNAILSKTASHNHVTRISDFAENDAAAKIDNAPKIRNSACTLSKPEQPARQAYCRVKVSTGAALL